MRRKTRWLEGDESYRPQEWYDDLQRHESCFAGLAPASMSGLARETLGRLPWRALRRARLKNLALLRGRVEGVGDWIVLPSTFGLVLVCSSSETADRLHRTLVDSRVFPARLWPLREDAAPADRDLSARLLMVHTDSRYSAEHMESVAEILCTSA